jgi:hypothetical protein
MLSNEETKRNERIMRCLRSEDGTALREKIMELVLRSINQLKTAREPIEIGRHQGRVEALEQILKMKEE